MPFSQISANISNTSSGRGTSTSIERRRSSAGNPAEKAGGSIENRQQYKYIHALKTTGQKSTHAKSRNRDKAKVTIQINSGAPRKSRKGITSDQKENETDANMTFSK